MITHFRSRTPPMMRPIGRPIGPPLLALLASARAATYYVTNATVSASDGSADAPFGSLRDCITQLGSDGAPGSCLFLEGEYAFSETVEVRGLRGEVDDRYIIGAAPDAAVTLIGTVDVPGPWIWQNDTLTDGTVLPEGHWVAEMPAGAADPWQLFLDGEMQTVARWPNAFWHDRSCFNDTLWAHGSPDSTYCGPELRDVQYAGPCRLVDATYDHPTDADLASTGLNLTGAAAILNIGHWYSFAAMITEHAPGWDNFTYARDDGDASENIEGWKVNKYKPQHDLYYVEGLVSLIDAPTEWAYDRASRTVHLRTTADDHPAAHRVQARVREYALAITGCSYLSVHGLSFFALTLYAAAEDNRPENDVHDLSFESLELIHPSAQKRMLGEPRYSWPTTLARKRQDSAANLTLFNCTFFGSEAFPAITLGGSGMLIENNLMEWTDWSAVSTKTVLYFEGDFLNKYGSGAMTLELPMSRLPHARNVARRNTIRYSGPSVGLAQGKQLITFDYNRVAHQFAIQEDGGLTQGGGLQHGDDPELGLVDNHNWMHDALVARSTKWGMRVDRTNSMCNGIRNQSDDKTWAYHTTFHHNVVWRCNGIMLKGNNHTVERNTIWETDPLNFESDGSARDLAVYSYVGFGTCECDDPFCKDDYPDTCCVEGVSDTYENINSRIIGNGLDGLGGTLGGSSAVPDTAAVDAYFPVLESVNNSAGALFEQLRDPHNLDFRPRPGSVWDASSIGAYDAVGDGGHYWIPGRLEWIASTPIPPHGTIDARVDADLMFLGAHGALEHRVYAGGAENSLALVATLEGDANVVTPPQQLMYHGASVHWRVDSRHEDGGEWRTGAAWHFNIVNLPPPSAPPAAPPPPSPPPPPCMPTLQGRASKVEPLPVRMRQSDKMSFAYVYDIDPGYPDGWSPHPALPPPHCPFAQPCAATPPRAASSTCAQGGQLHPRVCLAVARGRHRGNAHAAPGLDARRRRPGPAQPDPL